MDKAIFLLINVKMPTIVGILTCMSRKISCSVELSTKKSFKTWGPERKEFTPKGANYFLSELTQAEKEGKRQTYFPL